MLTRLMRYIAQQKLLMAGVLATRIGSTAVEMLSPWPMKVLVDNAIAGQPLFGHVLDGSLQRLLLVIAGVSYVMIAGLRGLIGLLDGRWLTEVTQKASLAMSSDLYAQVQRLSLRFHDRARVGDIVTRLTADVDQLQRAFIQGLNAVTVNVLSLVGMTAVMFALDWQFALVAMIVLPPLLATYSKFRGRVKAASRNLRASEGAIASAAYEALASIRVVKAFGQEERERERFVDQTRSKLEASVAAATWQGLFSLYLEIASAVGVATIMVYGGWRISQGKLTLGELYVFMYYLNALYAPLLAFTRLTSTAQKAAVSAERIEELFEAAPEVHESPHPIYIERSHGRITFTDVWFGYEPNTPVLKGINLDVAPGEVVALVGKTGAGKSTLVSLIPRFYDPSRGHVDLDRKDLRNLSLRSLREQISIVLQDPLLLSGTVRDNIAYGRPGATDDDILKAARAAYAHDFIVDLPEGYDSYVGERGVMLSGGQRQRIAIARALLKDAPILILDEPTSAVDLQSEALLMGAIHRLIQERTVILIAHRPSTTRLANRAVVLEDGAIVDTGRVEELQTRSRSYRELHALEAS